VSITPTITVTVNIIKTTSVGDASSNVSVNACVSDTCGFNNID